MHFSFLNFFYFNKTKCISPIIFNHLESFKSWVKSKRPLKFFIYKVYKNFSVFTEIFFYFSLIDRDLNFRKALYFTANRFNFVFK